VRRVAAALAVLGALVLAGAPAADANQEQVSWVRAAAARFVNAELDGNGAEACAVLVMSMRMTEHGRTCAQRWDARIRAMDKSAAVRRRWRAQAREVPSAVVRVNGNHATIVLPTRLIAGANHFLWTENCWMLTG